MSIHRRNTKGRGTTWVVRWRDPRPREKTLRTKAEAERFERGVRHQQDVGTYRDPSLSRLTFQQWHDRWWPTVESSDRAPNTVTQYEGILRLHVLPHLGEKRLASLHQIDLEEWLSQLRSQGLSASTVRTARTLAGMVLKSATDSGVIGKNPLAGIRLRSEPSTPRQVLTAHQVEALADAVDDRYKAMMLVLAYGGLRPGEATALRRRHLDDFGQLTVEAGLVENRGRMIEGPTKTRRTRIVPLPASVVASLRDHVERYVPADPAAPMFTTASGARVRFSNFRSSEWKVACAKAGLPDETTPYVLRHTAASLMAQRSVPPTTAAAVLGHDPAIFLRVYAHLYPGDLRAAAAALDGARTDARSKTKPPTRLATSARAGISRGRANVESERPRA